WTTLAVNAVGCALMGVLMVVITEVRPAGEGAVSRPGTGSVRGRVPVRSACGRPVTGRRIVAAG
ncbi:chromosome condensation protein CrcB, partial [Streptomyces caniferus]